MFSSESHSYTWAQSRCVNDQKWEWTTGILIRQPDQHKSQIDEFDVRWCSQLGFVSHRNQMFTLLCIWYCMNPNYDICFSLPCIQREEKSKINKADSLWTMIYPFMSVILIYIILKYQKSINRNRFAFKLIAWNV